MDSTSSHIYVPGTIVARQFFFVSLFLNKTNSNKKNETDFAIQLLHLVLLIITGLVITWLAVASSTAKVSSFFSVCCCFVLTEASVPVSSPSILSIFSIPSWCEKVIVIVPTIVVTIVKGPVVSVIASLAFLLTVLALVVGLEVWVESVQGVVGVDGLPTVQVFPALLGALAGVDAGKDQATSLGGGVSIPALGTLAAVVIVKGARLTIGNSIVVNRSPPSHDVSYFGNLSVAGINEVLTFIHKSRVTGSWCGEVDVALLALQVVVIASGKTGLLDTADKQQGISTLATFQIGGVAGNVVFESVLLLCTGDTGTATCPRECSVGGGEQEEISRRCESRVNVGFSQQVAECSEFVVVGVGANDGDNILIIINLGIRADGVSSRRDH